jgi:hypothetical protein
VNKATRIIVERKHQNAMTVWDRDAQAWVIPGEQLRYKVFNQAIAPDCRVFTGDEIVAHLDN